MNVYAVVYGNLDDGVELDGLEDGSPIYGFTSYEVAVAAAVKMAQQEVDEYTTEILLNRTAYQVAWMEERKRAEIFQKGDEAYSWYQVVIIKAYDSYEAMIEAIKAGQKEGE